MKRFLTILILLASTYSFAQNWEWAKPGGGSENDIGTNMVFDGINSIYAIGYFKDTATFPTGTLISAGLERFYLTKFDKAGNFFWTVQAGGDSDPLSRIHAMGLDYVDGYLYITGVFSGTVTFGSDTLISTIGCTSDIFIAKYDTLGNPIWAEKIGGIIGGRGESVTATANADFYITGFIEGPFTFDAITLTPVHYYDFFIAKYDSSNNVLWAKIYGDTLEDIAYAIAIDIDGNLYVAGDFQGDMVIGNTTLTSAGDIDAFVAKFDGDGNPIWSKNVGGAGMDRGYELTIDNNNDIVLTGSYSSAALFGSYTLNSAGGSDIYMCKFDSTGNVLWARSYGGSLWDEALAIESDSLNNLYLTGKIYNSALFDTTWVGTTGSHAFVAKFDELGNTIYVVAETGTAGTLGWELTVDNDLNPYITGNFGYTAGETGVFGPTTLTCNAKGDIMISKVSETMAPTGIANIMGDSKMFQIYPNPAREYITFKSSEDLTQYSVLNLMGEVVKSGDLKGENRIAINELSKGLYLLFLSNSSNSFLTPQKFVVN